MLIYGISSIRRHGYYLFHCSFCAFTESESEGVGRGQGLFTNSHKSLATCAISHPIGPLCTCASVYSNFNIVHTQLCIETDYTKWSTRYDKLV